MTPMLRRVLVVLSVLILSGCATKTDLDVGLKPSDAGRGALSSVPPAIVRVTDLVDQASGTLDRIGYTRNALRLARPPI